jgi:hypothetical protein
VNAINAAPAAASGKRSDRERLDDTGILVVVEMVCGLHYPRRAAAQVIISLRGVVPGSGIY